jgi:hypothetical protein
MDCRSARERSNAAVLGALTEAEWKDFFGHLACCPGCHADFERARRTAQLAAVGGRPADPDALIRRTVMASRKEFAKETA